MTHGGEGPFGDNNNNDWKGLAEQPGLTPSEQQRLVVLDEGDHPGAWPAIAKGRPLAYFKRSCVTTTP